MGPESYKEELFELGKGFELGLIPFESLTDYEKCELSRYFAIKNETLDNQITNTTASLSEMNNRLDEIYNDLLNMK